jgi:hypothetical protein
MELVIRDKVIYFGYGDIIVKAYNNGIVFTEIKPSERVGDTLNLHEQGVEIIQKIDILGFDKLYDCLNQIKHIPEDKKINCGEYILDFSNYNIGSVNVVTTKLRLATSITRLSLAC